jgi:hypothetical protein
MVLGRRNFTLSDIREIESDINYLSDNYDVLFTSHDP